MLFVSQSTANGSPKLPQPMAFFKPTSAPPATGEAVAYRFETEEQWNRQYWSQFAF